MKRLYTAESVTEGHPDKLCDLIADSILDECLKFDPESRVACEVLATKGMILAAGEITREEYLEWKLNWPQTADDCGKHTPSKQWRKE